MNQRSVEERYLLSRSGIGKAMKKPAQSGKIERDPHEKGATNRDREISKPMFSGKQEEGLPNCNQPESPEKAPRRCPENPARPSAPGFPV
jgi:hypothetical protein